MIASKDFFTTLLRELDGHPTLRHSFLARFANGVTLDQLRRYAAQHYAYSRQFTCNLAAVMSNTPDETARRLLALNIYEEIGEPLRVRDRAHLLLLEAGVVTGRQLGDVLENTTGNVDPVAALIGRGLVTREQVAEVVEARARANAELTHPALFRNFLRSVGIDPSAVAEPIAATLAFVAEVRRICSDEPWLAGLGALGPGTECVVPQLYSYVLRGLEVSGLIPAGDYVFWTLHVHCDEGHGRNMIDAMRPYADDVADQELIRSGALRVLDARQAWLDALEAHVFESSPAAGAGAGIER